MSSVRGNSGSAGGQGAGSLERLWEAVDEIRRATARIEERLGGPAGGYEGVAAEIGTVVETKIAEALGGRAGYVAGGGSASADIPAALAEIRVLGGEVAETLRALRADVARLLDARSNGLIDMLGPDGLR
jgi:hypothetical protein